MISDDNLDINSFHRTNLIIWTVILSGIIILFFVIVIINQLKIIQIIEFPAYLEKVLFVFAILLALVIIIFKRSIFLPSNLVNSVRNTDNPDKHKILLDKIRRNYIIIWSLGEIICIVGLIDYLLFVHLNSFFVYSIVSIYSILINIPRKTKVEKCFELLNLDQ